MGAETPSLGSVCFTLLCTSAFFQRHGLDFTPLARDIFAFAGFRDTIPWLRLLFLALRRASVLLHLCCFSAV